MKKIANKQHVRDLAGEIEWAKASLISPEGYGAAVAKASELLADNIKTLAAQAPGRIEVRDLYALYPDYDIDTATERARLAAARLQRRVRLHCAHQPGHAVDGFNAKVTRTLGQVSAKSGVAAPL